MYEKFSEVEEIINYKFKDIDLLVRAFTHNSYSTLKHTKNYQRLEFLGDSIVDFLIAKYLIEKFPNYPEGKLTKMRSQIVSENPLASSITRLKLEKYILLGVGEKKQNISNLPSVKSDIFEAIVGAIYQDTNDINKVNDFVITNLMPEIEAVDKKKSDNDDFKSKLNEYALKQNMNLEYKMVASSGPDHAPVYSYEVLLDGKSMGSGEGASKKIAQQNAANSALKLIVKK